MSFVAMLKGKGPSGFGYGSTAEQVTQGLDLSGKTYLLTGCNSGLGEETLRVLSLRGAHVLAAARSKDKAAESIKKVAAQGTPVACELSEPSSIRACIEDVKRLGRPLDGILCNAGIMALPTLETKFGYELQFFTNHIGHFILVTGLLDQLSSTGRVVVVSSTAHMHAPKEGILFDNLDGSKGYRPWAFYGQSKLANVLFAQQLAKRLEGTQQTANSLHPGVIPTNLARHVNPFVRVLFAIAKPLALKSIPQGSATTCYVATHPDAAKISGKYFADCNLAKTSKHGADEEMGARLWQVSQDIVAKL